MSQPSTQTGYDALGRPSAVTAPDGTRTEHRYGVVADGGTVLAWHDVLDPNRHRLQSRTDAFGRLVQVLEISGDCGSWGYTCSGGYTTPWTAGTTTRYSYDALDRLTTVTRGSLVTTIGYDAVGRKTQLQDPDMGPWTYAYDGAGNLVKQRDARNIATCLYYDALHRLAGKTYHSSIGSLESLTCPGSPYVVTYTYDAYDGTTQFGRGRRTGMVDRSGATTWTYDQRGRVTKEEQTITDVGTFRTQWGYRADDLASKMQFPGGPTGSIGEQVDFSYHPQQLVNRVSTTSQVYIASSHYDAAGRLTARSLGTDTVIATAAYFPWTTPTGQGRLQRLTAVKSADATTLQDLRYSTTSTGAVGYDAVGNLLRIEDWKAGSPQVHTYTYDERDRLLSASVTGGIGGNYSEVDTYDPVTGTLSSKAGVTYDYRDPAHRQAVTHRNGTLAHTYDANGNQT